MPFVAQVSSHLPRKLPRPYVIAWSLYLLLAYLSFIYILAYGIDITDEGFYLQAVSYPANDLYISTQFGFVLRPLWLLSGENVFLFRASFWTIQIVMSFVLFQSLIKARLALSDTTTNLLASTFAALILGYLHDWLPTPSYNSLALFAAQLFCIAFVVIPNWTVTRSLTIAAAGTLGFLSKPPIAVMMVLFCAVAALYSFNKNWWKAVRMLIFSASVSLLLLVLFASISHGSPIEFYNNITIAFRASNTLQGSNSTLSTWYSILWNSGDYPINIGKFIIRILCIYAFLFFISPIAISIKTNGSQGLRFTKIALITMTAAFIAFTGLVTGNIINNNISNYNPLDRLILSWLMPLCMLISLAISAKLSKNFKMRNLGIASLLVLTPYAIVLGTNLPYLVGISMLSIFSYAACLAMSYDRSQLLPLACLLIYGLCYLTLSLPFSGRELYRQPALWGDQKVDHAERITQGPLKYMILGETVDQYFKQLSDLAYDNGFPEGGGVIDLTGASPGALSAVGIKSIGTPWLIGKYPGSQDFARFKLEQAKRPELEAAWVLIEQWHRTVSPEVLDTMNRTLEEDYIKVGSITLPNNLGGRFTQNTQTLYKPIKR